MCGTSTRSAKIGTLKAHSHPIVALAFSPDGSLLASGALDEGVVKLWDVASRQERQSLRGHTDSVTELAFSPDGTMLASASRDTTVKLWDVQAARALHTFPNPDALWAVAFSPDGQMLAAGGDFRTVRVWNVASRKVLHDFHAHWGPVTCLAFSSDSQTLFTAGGDNAAGVWAVKDLPGPCEPERAGPLPTVTLNSHGEWAVSVAVAPKDGKLLAVPRISANARIWDLASFDKLKDIRYTDAEFAYTDFQSTVFSPDDGTLYSVFSIPELRRSAGGKHVVSCFGTRTVRPQAYARARTPGERQSRCRRRGTDWRSRIDPARGASSRCSTLAAAHRLWSDESSHGAPRSLAFSPDGNTLAVGTSSGSAMLLNAATGTPVREPLQHGTQHVTPVVYSPDGSILATSG